MKMINYSKKKSFKYSPQVLFRVTNTPEANEAQPISIGWNKIQYLSDLNGIVNEWEAQIDSSVAFVDTTIHYRYYTTTFAVSNYNSNILWHSSNGKQVARIFMPIERYVMSISHVNSFSKVLKPTDFMKFVSEMPDLTNEMTDAEKIYRDPRHAYTKALIEAIPVTDPSKMRDREPLEGEVPSPMNPPEGCAFGHRINAPNYEQSKGKDIKLEEIEPGHWVSNCPCCVDR